MRLNATRAVLEVQGGEQMGNISYNTIKNNSKLEKFFEEDLNTTQDSQKPWSKKS